LGGWTDWRSLTRRHMSDRSRLRYRRWRPNNVSFADEHTYQSWTGFVNASLFSRAFIRSRNVGACLENVASRMCDHELRGCDHNIHHDFGSDSLKSGINLLRISCSPSSSLNQNVGVENLDGEPCRHTPYLKTNCKMTHGSAPWMLQIASCHLPRIVWSSLSQQSIQYPKLTKSLAETKPWKEAF
jgi:hypothetical protein